MERRAKRGQPLNADPGGFRLLELLSLTGWSVDILSDGAGGVHIHGTKLGRRDVCATGASVATIAGDLYEEALNQDRAARLVSYQA